MNPASLAVFAYAWWGFVPLYWKELLAFPATELILYRVLLSTLFLFPFFLPARRRTELMAILRHPRTLFGLLASGSLIGFNWFLYVWAVNNGHVIDSSLGYFINPLMNVALGTLLLKEIMSSRQRWACALATLGVLLLAWSTGSFPWIALLLALSFALYGLSRKLLAVPTIPGTFVETVILTVPAGLALGFLYFQAQGHGLSATPREWITLAFCGAVTTIPLLAFAEAAKRMSLSVMGFFQFISPSIQFLLGVFVFREPFGLTQWLSFALIWVGLALFLNRPPSLLIRQRE
jgi:chloramphenicol-sensitive protein RarD